MKYVVLLELWKYIISQAINCPISAQFPLSLPHFLSASYPLKSVQFLFLKNTYMHTSPRGVLTLVCMQQLEMVQTYKQEEPRVEVHSNGCSVLDLGNCRNNMKYSCFSISHLESAFNNWHTPKVFPRLAFFCKIVFPKIFPKYENTKKINPQTGC